MAHGLLPMAYGLWLIYMAMVGHVPANSAHWQPLNGIPERPWRPLEVPGDSYSLSRTAYAHRAMAAYSL